MVILRYISLYNLRMKLKIIILILIYCHLLLFVPSNQPIKSSKLLSSTVEKRPTKVLRTFSEKSLITKDNHSEYHHHHNRHHSIDDELSNFREALISGDIELPPRGRFCLWGCYKQNTTHILLFTKHGTGAEFNSRVSKFTNPNEFVSKNSGFNPMRPTILLVHGFRGRGISHQRWAIDLKDLILRREKSNVFFADWNHHSHVLNYFHSLAHMPEVAQDLFDILKLYKLAFPRFNMNNVHVIGHSLGAHVGGLLGQMMDGNLNQITALDPTGVYLDTQSSRAKLSQDDAKYVVAHHTNSNNLGTTMNLADRDIYFNGGDQQAACDGPIRGIIPIACSHRQAVKYSSIYMRKCILMAYSCSSYDDFLNGECAFCARNSSACIGVGNEWQYLLKPGSLRPPKFDRKKEEKDKPWTKSGSDIRYFLKVGPERPYCIFTYQVVVKFSVNVELDDDSSYELYLKAQSDNQVVWFKVQLLNRISGDKSLEVYNKAGDSEFVSGLNVFTALALFDKSHIMYDKMPVKFKEAILPEFLTNKVDKIEVFVNFMSHVKFEERASNSGPVKVKSYNISQTVETNKKSRIASRDIDRRKKLTTVSKLRHNK